MSHSNGIYFERHETACRPEEKSIPNVLPIALTLFSFRRQRHSHCLLLVALIVRYCWMSDGFDVTFHCLLFASERAGWRHV